MSFRNHSHVCTSVTERAKKGNYWNKFFSIFTQKQWFFRIEKGIGRVSSRHYYRHQQPAWNNNNKRMYHGLFLRFRHIFLSLLLLLLQVDVVHSQASISIQLLPYCCTCATTPGGIKYLLNVYLCTTVFFHFLVKKNRERNEGSEINLPFISKDFFLVKKI